MYTFIVNKKAFHSLNLTPTEMFWRPKEAFSDSVATKKTDPFQYLQEYAETSISNIDLQGASI